MPLVFVHGVANRPSDERSAEVLQRDALFRAIAFRSDSVRIFNPEWGKNAASFTDGMPWLPDPNKTQAFGTGGGQASQEIGLGRIAKIDGAQAVDLTVLAALEEAIQEAGRSKQPPQAADKTLIKFAQTAADYLGQYLPDETQPSKGSVALASNTDHDFAEALDAELQRVDSGGVQAFGVRDSIRRGVDALGGWVGNALSDAALRAKRRTLSQLVALFLGDIFVYLKQRNVEGARGTRARLFEPILVDLIKGAKAERKEREPFVVVGHSLGGVLLYDILTDPACLNRIKAEAPGFEIDVWLTVGSQPGFFSDLALLPELPKNPAGLLEKPNCVKNWLNVYDYTDVFSFLCKPFFEGVDDFGYDTRVDLLHAHSSYFRSPSFYKRLELRLRKLGY
jgi:hypothetical protein